MIPNLIIVPGAFWPFLPAGVHDAGVAEVKEKYAINPRRRLIFEGFIRAAENLFLAGCTQIWLDGSFVTAKPEPSDFDALWDGRFVNPYSRPNIPPTFEWNP